MSEMQLDISLNSIVNPLKNTLDAGKFIFLAECTPP